MTPDQFKSATEVDRAWSLSLQALWHDAHGNWDRAHDLAQQAGERDGAWVHAYLHRKEGDEGNAAYWYRLAGKKKPSLGLEAEWSEIVGALLARS
jgi:hypothetical protein